MADDHSYRVGYARVSTDDQDLTLQIDALAKAGVRPDNIHTDTASSRRDDRPGLQAMWKDLREGDTLVIWKLDRLGRDSSQLTQTARLLREKNVHLLSLTEHLDTTTPHGMFSFNILAAVAQYERDVIRERTKAGLEAARARGRIGGRRTKFTEPLKKKARTWLAEGLLPREVATRLGLSPATIYKHMAELVPPADVEKEFADA